jgi:hypothetical protein
MTESQVLRLLVDSDCQTDWRNNEGFTPAEFAFSFGVLKELEAVSLPRIEPSERGKSDTAACTVDQATRRGYPRRPPAGAKGPPVQAGSIDPPSEADWHGLVAVHLGPLSRPGCRVVPVQCRTRPVEADQCRIIRRSQQSRRGPSPRRCRSADPAPRLSELSSRSVSRSSPALARDGRLPSRNSEFDHVHVPEHDLASAFPLCLGGLVGCPDFGAYRHERRWVRRCEGPPVAYRLDAFFPLQQHRSTNTGASISSDRSSHLQARFSKAQ